MYAFSLQVSIYFFSIIWENLSIHKDSFHFRSFKARFFSCLGIEFHT